MMKLNACGVLILKEIHRGPALIEKILMLMTRELLFFSYSNLVVLGLNGHVGVGAATQFGSMAGERCAVSGYPRSGG